MPRKLNSFKWILDVKWPKAGELLGRFGMKFEQTIRRGTLSFGTMTLQSLPKRLIDATKDPDPNLDLDHKTEDAK